MKNQLPMQINNKNNKPAPSDSRPQIDFVGIFKRAAKIVWYNRFLFWFGLLVALGSPGSFNFSPSGNDFNGNEAAKNYMNSHWQVVLAISIAAIVLSITFFLISLVAKAGLIKSVNLITQGKKTTFKKEWKDGKKYIWNLVKLFLAFLFTGITIFLVLAIPVIYFLVNQLWLWAFLIGLLAVAIFIPIIFVMSFTNIFAQFYIVLSNLRVRSAIETGYMLLVKNLGNSIIFVLLFIVVSIIFGIIMLPVIGLLLLVLVPAGILFYALNKIVFGIYLVFAILGAVAVILFFSAIYNAFKTTAWTLFFKEIAEIKKEEPDPVTEKEIAKDIAATPASPSASSTLQKDGSLGGPEKAL